MINNIIFPITIGTIATHSAICLDNRYLQLYDLLNHIGLTLTQQR